VAPLAQTTFNEAKSWLKPLEYSACGVPWVGSPSSEYLKLAQLCGAKTAERPKEWYRELRRLIEQLSVREEASGRCREAAANLTYEGNAHLWAEAWQAALEKERARRTTKIGV
jgi:uncharacterized membrane protein YccC